MDTEFCENTGKSFSLNSSFVNSTTNIYFVNLLATCTTARKSAVCANGMFAIKFKLGSRGVFKGPYSLPLYLKGVGFLAPYSRMLNN